MEEAGNHPADIGTHPPCSTRDVSHLISPITPSPFARLGLAAQKRHSFVQCATSSRPLYHESIPLISKKQQQPQPQR